MKRPRLIHCVPPLSDPCHDQVKCRPRPVDQRVHLKLLALHNMRALHAVSGPTASLKRRCESHFVNAFSPHTAFSSGFPSFPSTVSSRQSFIHCVFLAVTFWNVIAILLTRPRARRCPQSCPCLLPPRLLHTSPTSRRLCMWTRKTSFWVLSSRTPTLVS